MQLFSAGGGQREGRVADLAQRSAAAASSTFSTAPHRKAGGRHVLCELGASLT